MADQPDPRAAVLVDAATLERELHGDQPPTVLDVRWELGDPHGHAHYLAGHLPEAVFVDLDSELASPPSAAAGRHPLPGIDDLQAAARRWGVRRAWPVVVYDDSGGRAAARAWWLLRWAGVANVRILDGGLAAWRAGGGLIHTGESTAMPGDVDLTPGHLTTIDTAGAARWADGAILLDARAGERYRGEVEPIDPRAGHIPGARSAPTVDNLASDGSFRSTEELRERFAAVGVQPGAAVAVYCGSGVTAAHEIAALAVVGVDAALYPGSWSAWSGDAARRAAVGPLP